MSRAANLAFAPYLEAARAASCSISSRCCANDLEERTSPTCVREMDTVARM